MPYKDKNGEKVECRRAYTVTFNTKINPELVSLPRKKERTTYAFNGGYSILSNRIIGYEKVEPAECRCIQVSHQNGLFITNDYIVTHNSHIMLMTPLYNINNPLFVASGFRKEVGDIEDGLAITAKSLYSGVAKGTDSAKHWEFQSGAAVDFDHLQNEAEIDRRFRGVELPHIIIDELPQLQCKTMFTLLASNRNTIGVNNKFIASCNPVGKKHWVYKLLSWYIDEDAKIIRPDRNGKIRYFFKTGESVNDIAWGNSKREVYLKAKTKIDALLGGDSDADYEGLINSFCFIEGSYNENKIFKAGDTSYLAKLASTGQAQATKDVLGIWGDDEETECQLTYDELDQFLKNPNFQTTGVMRGTADVALSRDFFVLYAWDGNHLVDYECFAGVLSTVAAEMCRKFLVKHNIREENFAYDMNGIGLYLEGHFPKALGFNNKGTTSNPKLWDNIKSECAEKWINDVKMWKYSCNPELLDRKIVLRTDQSYSKQKKRAEETITFYDRFQLERQALRRKVVDNGRWEIIPKHQMKDEVGHSPDIVEGAFMHRIFPERQKRNANLNMW